MRAPGKLIVLVFHSFCDGQKILNNMQKMEFFISPLRQVFNDAGDTLLEFQCTYSLFHLVCTVFAFLQLECFSCCSVVAGFCAFDSNFFYTRRETPPFVFSLSAILRLKGSTKKQTNVVTDTMLTSY